MKPITANQYFQSVFGGKVYKLALDASMTCPNRDGTCGYGGCAFCADGAGEFAEKITPETAADAITRAIKRVCNKTKEQKFIAYFQSHTNTHAPVEYLKKLFFEVLKDERIVGLSVATRPDCLGDDIIALLTKLNCQKPLMVELGLQTADDKTAAAFNRGYSLADFDNAMKRLKTTGAHIVVHQILGLPNESEQTMRKTTEHIVKSGADGIKFHSLQILKNTYLADEYRAGKISVLTFEQYNSALMNCLSAVPENMVIHRITGDPPKASLIAPLWCADKKRVLNDLNRAIENL